MSAAWRTHTLLVGMAVLWGGSWPAGRVVAQQLPPLSSSAWRFTIAVVCLLVWMLATRGWPRLSGKQWAGLVAAGAVGVFGYAAFFMAALQQVEASRAAVVVTTNPVFTTVLAAWLFKERFNARIAAGLLLAVLGAATVLTRGAPWLLFSGAMGSGEWLLLGCIATWTGYSLMGKRLMVGIDSLTATTLTAVFGCALLWLAAVWVEGPSRAAFALGSLNGTGWFAMLFLALGSTVLAYAWYYRGIEELGAGVAASYISLVPVFGVGSAVLLLGEKLDASLLTGGALALAGVVWANRARSA
jgi:drug/metabolite transporter (DMT)-like permease